MHRIITLATIIFTGFIFWIIYTANTGQGTIFHGLVRALPLGDKIAHATLFGLLTLGINLAFRLKSLTLGRFSIFFGTLGVSLFVVVEELSQHFVDSRTMDVNDLIADAVGIVVFTIISWYVKRKLSIRSVSGPDWDSSTT